VPNRFYSFFEACKNQLGCGKIVLLTMINWESNPSIPLTSSKCRRICRVRDRQRSGSWDSRRRAFCEA